MKKLAFSALFSLLSLAAMPAMAELDLYDEPVYYGGLTAGSIAPSSGTLQDALQGASSSVGLLFGAQMSDRLGWELSARQSTYLNHFTQNVDATTMAAFGTVSKYLNEDWRFMGKIGFAQTGLTTKVQAVPTIPAPPIGSATNSGLAYGLGLDYKLDDFMMLRIGYDVFKAEMINPVTGGQIVTGSLTDMNLGLTYRF